MGTVESEEKGLTRVVRRLENFQTVRNSVETEFSSDDNNVTILCFRGETTVPEVKTSPQRNCEFSYYDTHLSTKPENNTEGKFN